MSTLFLTAESKRSHFEMSSNNAADPNAWTLQLRTARPLPPPQDTMLQASVRLQARLFAMGGEIAALQDEFRGVRQNVDYHEVEKARLEGEMDQVEKDLRYWRSRRDHLHDQLNWLEEELRLGRIEVARMQNGLEVE